MSDNPDEEAGAPILLIENAYPRAFLEKFGGEEIVRVHQFLIEFFDRGLFPRLTAEDRQTNRGVKECSQISLVDIRDIHPIRSKPPKALLVSGKSGEKDTLKFKWHDDTSAGEIDLLRLNGDTEVFEARDADYVHQMDAGRGAISNPLNAREVFHFPDPLSAVDQLAVQASTNLLNSGFTMVNLRDQMANRVLFRGYHGMYVVMYKQEYEYDVNNPMGKWMIAAGRGVQPAERKGQFIRVAWYSAVDNFVSQGDHRFAMSNILSPETQEIDGFTVPERDWTRTLPRPWDLNLQKLRRN